MTRSYSDTITKNITINVESDKVWHILQDISSMKDWAEGVIDVKCITTERTGIGAGRIVIFDDVQVEEYIVQWSKYNYAYIATSGLPFDIYIARLTITDKVYSTNLQWQSFLKSKDTTRPKFNKIVRDMKNFYQNSLGNLKSNLE